MIEVPVNSDIEIEAECAGEVLVQLVRQFNVEKEDVTEHGTHILITICCMRHEPAMPVEAGI